MVTGIIGHFLCGFGSVEVVSPLEFVLFLRTCHKEFTMVKAQLKEMNKRERLKFTVRRPTSIEFDGEAAVRKRECEMNKAGRGYQTLGNGLLGSTFPRRGSGSSRSGVLKSINSSSRSARTIEISSNSIPFSPMKKRYSHLSYSGNIEKEFQESGAKSKNIHCGGPQTGIDSTVPHECDKRH